MAATNWDGTAALQGLASSGGVMRKIDRQPRAKLTAAGSAGEAGYTSSLFSALVNLVEAETDAAKQRDALSALVAYFAAVKAQSVQDRASLAHTISRHTKDIDLTLNYLLGKFGPAGLPLDEPSQDRLSEIEAVVGAKRANAGKAALPGTSY